MRLKQNADAYQCEIVFILFGEKQHNGVYCMFHPLTVQKCLIESPNLSIYSASRGVFLIPFPLSPHNGSPLDSVLCLFFLFFPSDIELFQSILYTFQPCKLWFIPRSSHFSQFLLVQFLLGLFLVIVGYIRAIVILLELLYSI